MQEVFIVSVSRTPIGSFGGTLSSLTATQLGAVAIKNAVERAHIKPSDVQEVYMGNVLSAGLGQAPARQAAIFAGLTPGTTCTTVNKVCASGMKAIVFAAQSIMLGISDVVVAGGMESMSNVPYYLDKARNGYRLGHGQVMDGIIKDGLWDVYNDFHMGTAAELCATEMNISREEQDNYAIESYSRSTNAWQNQLFSEELSSVEIPVRGGDPVKVTQDEEYKKVKFDKIKSLKPVFKKEGTVTAANSSKINDGAAAVVLMSKKKVEELGIKPIARIMSFADAEQEPEKFSTSPSLAIPKAMKLAGLNGNKADFYEINEAFSVVAIANNQILQLDPAKVNVLGGAVALGHPIGCSGTRITITLTSVLKQKNGHIGVAGICNGGGGATAIVLERVN
ncbi:MAG: acetyl-CoA acetyltransferase [Bacteroidetes bacterium RIFCSPLOWO2_02_FULL_36_8]|nr:MAG: acetyl-CoA acetyltransferase [Bacteroidetes bacterium RIFCSPLOWO2_02_FULL_36_8]OFY71409.1 MAG: acetyl-CoA acetyltransferase [Bacteroidetes bacterium RIFCSPLOWO2_12_FULL_37_12]